ncbi:MAG: nucleoside monophosphate kinase [Buchnera aphidicola (Melaphis rhois)]
MRIVLLGAPGSGKGTQAQFIEQKYHLPKISIGDILRQIINDNAPLSKQIKSTIYNGKLISDEIVTELVQSYITKIDYNLGFILDGFPRTISQAKMIENNKISIDYFFELKIPTKIILERIQKRRIGVVSKNTYHLNNSSCSKNINCANSIQRFDDNTAVIKTRLEEYNKFTIPLINYLNNSCKKINYRYYIIDGTQTIQNINNEIKKILN